MIEIYEKKRIPENRIRKIVVAARLHGAWIYVRNAGETWEMPNGCVCTGETPKDAAKRILAENLGCRTDALVHVADFECECGGALFFSELESIPGSAQTESILIDALPPANQTHPERHAALFAEMQDYLNRQTSSDECWDVLDARRRPTGRLHRRGDPLAAGEYHLVVQVWIQNREGAFLLTRRAPNKGNSLLWETVGGSAVAGDDSRSAAIREVREETGIVLNSEEGTLLETHRGVNAFCDVWKFRCEFELEKVAFQPGETCAAMAADREKLRALCACGRLVSAIPENI